MNFFNNIPQLNNFITNINPSAIRFRGAVTELYPAKFEPRKDSFNSNPLYGDNFYAQLELSVKNNPRIKEITKQYGFPLKINIQELENLKSGHLMDARVTAAKIYSALPSDMKTEVNLADLQQAAMLHDIGKIIIPDKILNKKGTLTPDEREIIEQHSEIGYEMLKDMNIKPEVLELVKYHHQNQNGSGYPQAKNDFEYNLGIQILKTADKYTALTEDRSYKKAMPKEEALKIIYEDVQSGEIPIEIYNALKNTA